MREETHDGTIASRYSFAKAFSWDTGTNVGTIERHEKRINTCAARCERPFRVVTGSEDLSVNWYEGPPFKFKNKITQHSRFVNCVRFAPNGSTFASCGSDTKVFIYDGKAGTPLGEMVGHDGGVYALSFSPDSTRLLTASADRSCRLWDVATQALLTYVSLACSLAMHCYHELQLTTHANGNHTPTARSSCPRRSRTSSSVACGRARTFSVLASMV